MINILINTARLLLIVTLLFIGPGIVPVKASNSSDNNIRVILDANLISFSKPPYIENSTTLVQFRPIFESLGLEVSWDKFTRTVKGSKQGVLIELQIDNPVAKVNGKPITLSVAPKLKDGHTFVPLRFISESVDSKVEWDDSSRTVVIYSKNNYASADGKFHFTAYGLWRNMAGLDKIKSEDDERVQDFVSVEDVENIQLALRYFNYTMLFISAEP
ncbi:copper amine oxidase N-terminal domain-containing protein [Paenibacillus sp. GCM10023252]|uniref:copper amine oxidase N-terminal domain-containing protein n=1 Tax=Paenibacillus sp. GCM10023252 TaxID=3252649 RepID=UPI00361C6585